MERSRKVLLLSYTYTPVGIITWRKAFDLVWSRNKAEVITQYKDGRYTFNPAVVRLTVKTPDMYRPWVEIKFSKRMVLARDEYLCAYCNKQLSSKTATIDHILPKSRGGKNTFMNCVACCSSCNKRKNNKTPAEAGMINHRAVRNPTARDIFLKQEEWNAYI